MYTFFLYTIYFFFFAFLSSFFVAFFFVKEGSEKPGTRRRIISNISCAVAVLEGGNCSSFIITSFLKPFTVFALQEQRCNEFCAVTPAFVSPEGSVVAEVVSYIWRSAMSEQDPSAF